MPTEYKGASIEPQEMDVWDIADAQKLLYKELIRRGWVYVRELGYKPFREKQMNVILHRPQQGVQLVILDCSFEEHYNTLDLHFDVPVKHFNSLVPPKKQEPRQEIVKTGEAFG